MSRVPSLVLLLLLPAAAGAQSPIAEIVLATPGVSFSKPVGVELAPGQPGRLYVLEQGNPARIRTVVPGDAASTVFLDLGDRASAQGEGGLLGLAFHPEYAANGRLFVSYTAPVDSPVPGVRVLESRVSEFARDAADPLRADPASERVLLAVDQPLDDHNGGTIDFGPEGHLYIGLGDGGGSGDPYGNGLDPTTLLGALLRIAVDDVPEGLPYGIPEDNPYAATDGPERDEIYAYGFRNPFKFDVNSTGVWVADVGQDTWEEVNRVRAGGNYGWNAAEGPDCFPPGTSGCGLEVFEAPLFAYPHDGTTGGYSITGGFVTEDVDLALSGSYLFGDFVTGRLWALEPGATESTLLADRFPRAAGGEGAIMISSIDPDGVDILVTDYGGTLYRVVRTGTAAEARPHAGALRLAGPNPFRDRTALAVTTPDAVRVTLLDTRGREVAVLWDGPPPRHPIAVHADGLPPGVFVAVARTAAGERSVLRLVRVR